MKLRDIKNSFLKCNFCPPFEALCIASIYLVRHLIFFPSDIEALINQQSDLTDEEKAFLKKLNQEPTSLSADLVPRSNSFVSNYVPKPVDVNQAR